MSMKFAGDEKKSSNVLSVIKFISSIVFRDNIWIVKEDFSEKRLFVRWLKAWEKKE